MWEEGGAQAIPPDTPELKKFVCEDLDCLPLAVVLVAALGRFERSLTAVMRRWQEEGVAAAQRTGLSAEVSTEAARLDSLEHSILLSHRRLSQEAKLLWGLAAFFPSGLPQGFLAELLRDLPALRGGRDQLLLHRILHPQPDDRLRLSPPLARFAQSHARNDELGFEANAIFNRLAPWFKGLGIAANKDREGKAITQLFEEFPSLEALVLFFTALPALPEGLLPMLQAWGNFYSRRIFHGKKILDAVLTCAPKLFDYNHAWVLEYSGDLIHLLGENSEARSRYEAALPLYEKVGSDLGKANTLQGLGDLALRLGENSEARKRFDAALPLYEKMGDDLGKANILKCLGVLAVNLKEYTKAQSCFDEALSIYEKVGSDLGKANTLRCLGDLSLLLGENANARSYYNLALPLFERVGDNYGKSLTFEWLGDLEKGEQNWEAATQHWANALALYQKISVPLRMGYCHVELARVAHKAGKKAEAQEHLRQAQACSAKVGNPHLAGLVADLERELGG